MISKQHRVVRSFVDYLHQHSKNKFVLYATGGGTNACSWLISLVGGASNTVLEISIPYTQNATKELCSTNVSKYVSLQTVMSLSQTAYKRAIHLQEQNLCSTLQNSQEEKGAKPDKLFTHRIYDRYKIGQIVCGISCSAAIRSIIPRKGSHRAFVCVHGLKGYDTYELTLEKEKRTREEEDELISLMILRCIAEYCFGEEIVDGRKESSMDSEEHPVRALLEHLEDSLYPVEKIIHRREYYEDRKSKNDDSDECIRLEKGVSSETKNSCFLNMFMNDKNSNNKEVQSEFLQKDEYVYQIHGENGLNMVGSSLIPLDIGNEKETSQKTHLVLYPGSFNPLHKGHILLLESGRRKAESMVLKETLSERAKEGQPVCENQKQYLKNLIHNSTMSIFEISLKNIDKGAIQTDIIYERMRQFEALQKRDVGNIVLVSHAPLFYQKARLFKGGNIWFVVGYDTIIRILDTKYYESSESKLVEALLDLRINGCKFVIGGRFDKELNKFLTIKHLKEKIPKGFESMFIGLSEKEFRIDISSTELRQRENKN